MNFMGTNLPCKSKHIFHGNILRRSCWSKHHAYIKPIKLLYYHVVLNYLTVENSIEVIHLLEQSMNFPSEMPCSNLACVFDSLNKDGNVWVSSSMDRDFTHGQAVHLHTSISQCIRNIREELPTTPSTHIVLLDEEVEESGMKEWSCTWEKGRCCFNFIFVSYHPNLC